MKRRLLLFSLLFGILWSALFANAPKLKVILGFSENQPAVFLQAKAGMSIHLKGITYDQFGYVAGYEEEISSGDQAIRIKIVADSALKPTMPETYLYSVEVDGKASKSLTLAEWQKTETKGFLGFAPKGVGGAVIKSSDGLQADFKTSFAYDDFGRRMISTEEFMLEGVKYLIAYSGYKFDQFGRLSTYSAEFKAEK
jgi:hypothetical protein